MNTAHSDGIRSRSRSPAPCDRAGKIFSATAHDQRSAPRQWQRPRPQAGHLLERLSFPVPCSITRCRVSEEEPCKGAPLLCGKLALNASAFPALPLGRLRKLSFNVQAFKKLSVAQPLGESPDSNVTPRAKPFQSAPNHRVIEREVCFRVFAA